MNREDKFSIYEMSINLRATLHAHSLSNAGDNGSIRLFPRRQMLGDGSETDACSGNIAKHNHAEILAEIMEEAAITLCPACSARDSRRAAALVDRADYKKMSMADILRGCGICDAHGFLITGKKATADGGTEARERLSKHSLIEFSFALALPGQYGETVQLMTRMGASKEEGQMLMKIPARSGTYALGVRYKCVGIGVDTDKWIIVLTDEHQRRLRHKAVLSALRDQLLSPSGALTSTMLPHLTGLTGAIVIRTNAGRAPMYSGLADDFTARLTAMGNEQCQIIEFKSVDDFCARMDWLIVNSHPQCPMYGKPL
jgi:CRISPR-associated protein Cst2